MTTADATNADAVAHQAADTRHELARDVHELRRRATEVPGDVRRVLAWAAVAAGVLAVFTLVAWASRRRW